MNFIDLFLLFVSYLILILMVLMGVAFLTLMERKILGYIQIRSGPVKVGLGGFFQPFSDALKLFSKEQTFPFMSNFSIYYLCPLFSMLFSLMIWLVIPFLSVMLNFNFSFLFFFCLSGFGVYSIMLSGWSSNSSYSLLGSLRSIAQSISYEVSLGLISLSIIYMVLSLNFLTFFVYQIYFWFFVLMYPVCLMWLISSIAETNRTPFDFAEGESELVSGFNVEYSSGGFSMIFISEYSSIMFMSFIFVLIFLGGDIYSFFFFFKVNFLIFFWVWVRGSFPRFRYDKLMYLSWKIILPSSLMFLIYFFGLKMYLFSFL